MTAERAERHRGWPDNLSCEFPRLLVDEVIACARKLSATRRWAGSFALLFAETGLCAQAEMGKCRWIVDGLRGAGQVEDQWCGFQVASPAGLGAFSDLFTFQRWVASYAVANEERLLIKNRALCRLTTA